MAHWTWPICQTYQGHTTIASKKRKLQIGNTRLLLTYSERMRIHTINKDCSIVKSPRSQTSNSTVSSLAPNPGLVISLNNTPPRGRGQNFPIITTPIRFSLDQTFFGTLHPSGFSPHFANPTFCRCRIRKTPHLPRWGPPNRSVWVSLARVQQDPKRPTPSLSRPASHPGYLSSLLTEKRAADYPQLPFFYSPKL